MRLLLVEDDVHLGSAMKRALEDSRYTVDVATRADDADIFVRTHRYSVILLDLGLPYGSGLDVLRSLRNHGIDTPVIIVTAQDRLEQRIAGLDTGADDYLVKPIDIDELVARVRAQIRRSEGRSDNILVARNVSIDLIGNTAHRDGIQIPLTAKEFKLVALLMRRPGRFISKEEIDTALYDGDNTVTSNATEVAISSARRKLGRDFIVTARGLGYMVPK